MIGSIPAHAGEPPLAKCCISFATVYPRPRGGTPSAANVQRGVRGLSPPTRGNPCGSPLPPRPPTVYPRPRGGTPPSERCIVIYLGLSPPTRGNHQPEFSHHWFVRSIPAHAGEPARALGAVPKARVYPRPRGGTRGRGRRGSCRYGLSPPTRGNLRPPTIRATRHGSIPAHAGEPRSQAGRTASPSVYPRPRGGTIDDGIHPEAVLGLSPPTRGNPPRRRSGAGGLRSIPAHAGEPAASAGHSDSSSVYPRPRGGTWKRV